LLDLIYDLESMQSQGDLPVVAEAQTTN